MTEILTGIEVTPLTVSYHRKFTMLVDNGRKCTLHKINANFPKVRFTVHEINAKFSKTMCA